MSTNTGVQTAPILLVEDEPSIAEAVRYSLEAEGFRVVVAVDGRQAMQTFASSKPSLVLLDLMIPHMSGLDVCRMIRRESIVPIIMLTAKDAEADKVVSLEIGAETTSPSRSPCGSWSQGSEPTCAAQP